jgi:hypothetical protein
MLNFIIGFFQDSLCYCLNQSKVFLECFKPATHLIYRVMHTNLYLDDYVIMLCA